MDNIPAYFVLFSGLLALLAWGVYEVRPRLLARQPSCIVDLLRNAEPNTWNVRLINQIPGHEQEWLNLQTLIQQIHAKHMKTLHQLKVQTAAMRRARVELHTMQRGLRQGPYDVQDMDSQLNVIGRSEEAVEKWRAYERAYASILLDIARWMDSASLKQVQPKAVAQRTQYWDSCFHRIQHPH